MVRRIEGRATWWRRLPPRLVSARPVSTSPGCCCTRSLHLRKGTGDADYRPAQFALIVPSGRALTAAKRVHICVRSTLAIDICEVRDDDSMALHGSTPVTDPDNLPAGDFHHRDGNR